MKDDLEYRAASSSSSDSVFERSDGLATRRLGQESLSDDKKDANDPLAALPFWLEDFTDNLEPTEVHWHTFLRTQIRNILRKWQRNRGNTVFSVTPRRTEIATSA